MMLRIFACLIVLGLFALSLSPAYAEDDVFKRVNDSKTLRCGYYVWPPYVIKDPNTGKMSGFYYDLANEIGRLLDLKIEWTEEISWSNMFEGFQTNRIDSYCASIIMLPSYAKATDFTQIIGYEPFHIFVRADDTRFDADASKVNDPAITISVMEGEVAEKIADQKYPQAKKLAVPSNSDTTMIAMNVVTKKADVLITNMMLGRKFMATHPGTLKLLTKDPIQKLPNAIPVPPDNYRLKRMLDIAIQTLGDNGFIKALGDKYYGPNEFIPVQSGGN